MSKKYVPPFMMNKAVTSAEEKFTVDFAEKLAVSEKPLAVEKPLANRWTRDEKDIYRISPTGKIVNTSLPAKMAPKLAPATLASLTAGTLSAVSKSPVKLTLSSDQDFPSLTTKKTVTTTAYKQSFSDLSRAWAKTQKEDDVKAKEEAEKEAARLRQFTKEEAIKGNIQEEARKMGIRIISMSSHTKKRDSDEEQDPPTESLSEEDSYCSEELPVDEEEEEEEYGCDGNWNGRKHRDELY